MDLSDPHVYGAGWVEYSSSGQCTSPRTCYCLGSGVCICPSIYFYMLEQDDVSEGNARIMELILQRKGEFGLDTSMDEDLSTVLELDYDDEFEHYGVDDEQTVTVEEIPVCPSTTGTMTTFVNRHLPPANNTLLSYFNGQTKTFMIDVCMRVTVVDSLMNDAHPSRTLAISTAKDSVAILDDNPEFVTHVVELVNSVSLSVACRYGMTSDSDIVVTTASPHIHQDSSYTAELDRIKADDLPLRGMSTCTLFVSMNPVSIYGGSSPTYRVVTAHIVSVSADDTNTPGLSRLHGPT